MHTLLIWPGTPPTTGLAKNLLYIFMLSILSLSVDA